MLTALVLLILALALYAWSRRGDGRHDLRRCPRCWYSMAATPALTCPECGHTATDDRALHKPRPKRWAGRLAIVSAFAAAGFFIAGFSQRPWISRVPTPILRWTLDTLHPVERPAIGLPAPDPAHRYAKKPYERARWHHTVAAALDIWVSEATGTQGPITDDELARLVPLARDANELYAQYGGTIHNEIRLIDRVQERLARRWRSVRDDPSADPDRVLRLEWALAELQFRGGGYSHRDDWALPPTALVLQAIAHPDPDVRIFGLDRAGRVAQVVVMEPANQSAAERLLHLVGQVDAAAASDPEPAVRKRAEDLRTYLRMLAPRAPGGG